MDISLEMESSERCAGKLIELFAGGFSSMPRALVTTGAPDAGEPNGTCCATPQVTRRTLRCLREFGGQDRGHKKQTNVDG